MAGYSDTRQLIIDTLMGRPAGTEIQPQEHQTFALQITDYIRAVELVAGNATPIGFADASTVPVQPNNGQAVYLSSVNTGTTVTYTNFHDQNGDAISITSASNVVKMVILLWNGQYWSSQVTAISVVTNTANGWMYRGVISSLTASPATISVPSYYIAALVGTYTNFSNLAVSTGEIAIFKTSDNGATWTKESYEITMPTSTGITGNIQEEVNELLADTSTNNFTSLPTLGGQPMVLFGDGIPQASTAQADHTPSNWNSFDPETEEGSNWNGLPTMIGQRYVDNGATTTSTGEYIAIRSGNYGLAWLSLKS